MNLCELGKDNDTYRVRLWYVRGRSLLMSEHLNMKTFVKRDSSGTGLHSFIVGNQQLHSPRFTIPCSMF